MFDIVNKAQDNSRLAQSEGKKSVSHFCSSMLLIFHENRKVPGLMVEPLQAREGLQPRSPDLDFPPSASVCNSWPERSQKAFCDLLLMLHFQTGSSKKQPRTC